MKRLILVLFVTFISLGLNAQSRLAYTEFGIGIGTLNYSGDIATTMSTAALLKEARPNVSVLLKKHTNDWFAFGLHTSYGWIYANDINHSNQNRGLQVSTSMFQVNPFIEMGLIRFGKYHLDQKFSIYLKTGAGFLAYNPDPSANEVYPDDMDPRPNAYTSINYFYGTGVKFRLGFSTILSFEALFHNAGADDVDGVLNNVPADAGKNDTYGGVNLIISKAIF